ncbi:BgTH12-07813 [Blumeria graminis f. sp. triticale]|uniref:BgTH12-07813 n=1 Tax=Blumeria graminis f. sp. triticale TaxID=1689686 RepID=A0A9W4GIF4_BLUGR|nr:BgTH12-07813 [Blumeria graminis f. sp. triticale]
MIPEVPMGKNTGHIESARHQKVESKLLTWFRKSMNIPSSKSTREMQSVGNHVYTCQTNKRQNIGLVIRVKVWCSDRTSASRLCIALRTSPNPSQIDAPGDDVDKHLQFSTVRIMHMQAYKLR